MSATFGAGWWASGCWNAHLRMRELAGQPPTAASIEELRSIYDDAGLGDVPIAVHPAEPTTRP